MTLHLRTRILLGGLLWSALLFAVPPAANAGLILHAPTYMGLNSGLVGWWTFDGKDTAGNITYDRSGQGNNGALTAGTVRGLGNIGQAMEFDGVDDSIDFTTTNGLNNLGQMTVSLWVRPHTFGESDPGAAFIAKNEQECFGSLDGGWTFGLDWAGGINGSLCFQKGYQDQNLFVASVQDTVTLNEWQHVVVVWDGTAEADNVRFYRNTSLAGIDFSEDGTGPLADDSTFNLGIGEQPNDSSLNYDGSIDDVRIYNRQLTFNEVKRLYKIGATAKFGVSNSSGSLASGLVGWWTFDGKDTAGNITYDRSGQGNNGTLTDNPTRTVGKIGQALNFDGVLARVFLGDVIEPNTMTIAAWVKPNVVAIDQRIVSKWGDTAGERQYLLSTDNGTANLFTFVISSASNVVDICDSSGSAGEYAAGSWSFVVGIYDGSTCKIYVNGVDVTNNMGDAASENIWNTASTLRIAIESDFSISPPFSGVIDDVRIYNRALTPDEVKRLYKMGSTLKQGVASSNGSLSTGLVGWWTFDGKDTAGNITYDRSGQGNNGMLIGDTARTIGKIGQGLSFDGVGDNVNLGDIPTVGTVTVAAWVKAGAVAVNQRIVSKWTDEYVLSTDDSVANQFTFGAFAEDDNDFCDSNVSGGAYTVGTWVFVVGIYASETCRIYVNGVDVTVVQQDDATGVIENTSRPLRIGIEGEDGISNPFNGTIDDVRIYNRALTADEIKRLYNMGR